MLNDLAEATRRWTEKNIPVGEGNGDFFVEDFGGQKVSRKFF